MEKLLTLGVTGHRNIPSESFTKLREAIKNTLLDYLSKFERIEVYNGMAIGYDQLVCEVILELQKDLTSTTKIGYVACIPCAEQDKMWPSDIKKRYQELLTLALRIEQIDPGPYSRLKMLARNDFIVDHSDQMLCYWDRTRKSGTTQCMYYAKQKNLPHINLYSSV